MKPAGFPFPHRGTRFSLTPQSPDPTGWSEGASSILPSPIVHLSNRRMTMSDNQVKGLERPDDDQTASSNETSELACELCKRYGPCALCGRNRSFQEYSLLTWLDGRRNGNVEEAREESSAIWLTHGFQ